MLMPPSNSYKPVPKAQIPHLKPKAREICSQLQAWYGLLCFSVKTEPVKIQYIAKFVKLVKLSFI